VRIGVVSPYAWTVPGGVNNHIMSLVEQLDRRGHQTWVIAPAGDLTHAPASLPDNFITAGRAIPVKANGSVAYVSPWPLMLPKMARIFAACDLDLVHVHEPTIPATGAAATMAARIPVVGTFHAAGTASGYYQRFRPLADRIMASIVVRIAVSETARECVVAHFPGDYRVIPNGIDVGQYAPARTAGKTRGRILFIGRVEPRKGLSVLLEAFASLRRQMPEASLVLAGPNSDELRVLIQSRNGCVDYLEGVEVLGRVPVEMKLEQMRKAEVLCAPSLGDESFGIVLTEALAAGIPVVASDIPGYRAVLAEGAAGVLVPPGEPSALANALLSLLQNPDLRRDLSTAGIARAERYSWDRVIGQVLEAYEDALAAGPCVVRQKPVPLFGQIRHSLRARSEAATLAMHEQPALSHARYDRPV
jgi:phosphatidylinositol alpha-mannosyltransferase